MSLIVGPARLLSSLLVDGKQRAAAKIGGPLPSRKVDMEPQPPHAVPEEAKPFITAMTENERLLHEMSIELLGSSYFVESSHAFRKWKANLNRG